MRATVIARIRSGFVASGVPKSAASCSAKTAIPQARKRLVTIETVATVGAISSGSRSDLAIAELTPSSAMLTSIACTVSAAVNVPNSAGATRRAMTTISPMLAKRIMTTLAPDHRAPACTRARSDSPSGGGHTSLGAEVEVASVGSILMR
jgi:hypothetical protein